MITFNVPPGIGDAVFLFQKLIHTGQKFNFNICDSNPRRGKQIFDLMPSVVQSAKYKPLHLKNLLLTSVHFDVKFFERIKDNEVHNFSFNLSLDSGSHISNLLPDLQTTYKLLPFETSQYKERAFINHNNIIGVYCSAYKNNQNWGGWSVNNWLNICKMFYNYYDNNNKPIFVLLGADFDTDLTTNLKSELDKIGYENKLFLGDDLGLVIEVIKQFNHFLAFPSGLPILAYTYNVPTTMLYPEKLYKLMYAWVSNKKEDNKHYNPQLWDEEKKIFQTIINADLL